jgi:hypothetical protein
MIVFKLEGNNFFWQGGGGHRKIDRILLFKKNKKEKLIPFYCCFRLQGVAIL